MLKKITLIFYFFYFLFFNGLSLAAERNDKNLLAFGAGLWDWNDNQTAGLFNVEYRHGTRYGPFKPMIGGLINTDHGFHIYAGIRMDLYLTNKIVVTPSFAPGLYERGDGKDLGLRKLSTTNRLNDAMNILKSKARKKKKTMWSRRAQEYEEKILSGNLVLIAEVLKELYKKDSFDEASFSEKQIYTSALDRLSRELAAMKKLDKDTATKELENILKSAA